jgi:cell wall-associated NlpC family hydrolase
MRIKVIFIFLFICTLGEQAIAQRSNKENQTNLIISSVKSYLGTPYQYGGMSRKGIDCSALMYISYAQGGIELPRVSKEQSKVGKNVKIGRVRPGDLVFFKFKQKGEKTWHSGIIVSVEKDKIKFVHASSSKGVIESDLYSDYYFNNIKGFRRVI